MTAVALCGIALVCVPIVACAQPGAQPGERLWLELDPLQSAVTRYIAIGSGGVTYLEYDRYRLSGVRAARSGLTAEWTDLLRRAAALPPLGPPADTQIVEDDTFRIVYRSTGTTRTWAGRLGRVPADLQGWIGGALVLAMRLPSAPVAIGYLRASQVEPQRQRYLAERGRAFNNAESLPETARALLLLAAASEGEWIAVAEPTWRQLLSLPSEQREYVRAGQVLYQFTTLAGANPDGTGKQ